MDTLYLPAERATLAEELMIKTNFADAESVKMALDAMPDVAAIMNKQRQLFYANDALLKFLGFKTPDEIKLMRLGESLQCMHAFEKSGGCGTTESCRYCGAAQAMEQSMMRHEKVKKECRITVQKEETTESLDFDVTVTPFEYKGEVYYILALTDISDKKRRHMLERIFFHDIINLAGGLNGLMELLKTGTENSGEMGEYITMAEQVSRELIDEITSQRALLAAENGELIINEKQVNSLQILKSVQSFFQHHSSTAGKQLEISKDAFDITLFTDETLLKRILINMVKNGLEAIKAGEKVTLCCHVSKNMIYFLAHNQGVIPKVAQMQIFQRSFSTKGSNRGLGTYSIKLLGEQYLGGNVGFTTSDVGGTQFYIALPLPKPNDN